MDSPFGRDIAYRVLERCLVLTWSAFEVFVSDLFVLVVNTKPGFAGTLLKDERTKALYNGKEIALLLERYGYDLSRNMGSVLIEQSRLDDLPTIKNIYKVILGPGDVVDKLDDVGLWKLYKTRNVIVHRAGIVDEQFRRDTGSTIPVGERITIKPVDLHQFMNLVGTVGVSIASAVENIIQ